MIPFSPPHIDQKTIDEVVDTLKSGWITTGPKTKRFEKEIAKYIGAENVLCLNSATAGLELMLRWFGVGEGDEVILPAYTYSATANVVIHCGATPILVDVNKRDFNIDVSKIKAAITSKTKVIMPVDFGGYPCDYSEINQLINSTEVKNLFIPKGNNQETLGRIMVLSDAAHSFGAKYKGQKTGVLCDVSVFSFHAVKNLTTSEGGAIAFNFASPFNNQSIYNDLCISSLHGQNKDALAKMQKGNWKYDIIEAGYKCNMTDISASIGLVQLDSYDHVLKRRKEIVEQYLSFFSGFSWAENPVFFDGNKTSSFHLFPLRIKGISEEQRDLIIAEIFNLDVSVNVHFIPIPKLSYYSKLGYKMENYPTTYDNFSREISLPIFFDLSNEQVKEVCRAVELSVNKIIV